MAQTNPIEVMIAKVARTLRLKKRDLTTNFQATERALMRSFELDTKEKILTYSATHLRLKQENQIMQEALTGMDLIHSRVAEFLAAEPPEELETLYSHICTFQPILSIAQFDNLISNRPPKEKLPVKVLEVLSEKDNGAYAKKFAEAKGSTQGMTERLRALFPPPKQKHQRSAHNRKRWSKRPLLGIRNFRSERLLGTNCERMVQIICQSLNG
jgi:hypothetical protein